MTNRLINLLWIGIFIGVAACSTATSTPLVPTAVIQPPLISPTAPPETRLLDTLPPPQPEVMSSTLTPSIVTPKTTHEDWFYTSPDGQWTVQVSAEFPIAADGSLSGERYRLTLAVFRKDGGLRWDVLDEERPFGLGYTLPAQFHWSKDGSQLFYTEHGIPDGNPTIVGFDCGLYRVNLQSGERTQLSGDCGLLRAAGDGGRRSLSCRATVCSFITWPDKSFARLLSQTCCNWTTRAAGRQADWSGHPKMGGWLSVC